jgi:hypothetical protein
MTDFCRKADFLKEEIEELYRLLRRGGKRTAKEAAVVRLQTALGTVEAWAEDPGPAWERLPLAQRWGYLRLVSHVGMAMHELKKLKSDTKSSL